MEHAHSKVDMMVAQILGGSDQEGLRACLGFISVISGHSSSLCDMYRPCSDQVREKLEFTEVPYIESHSHDSIWILFFHSPPLDVTRNRPLLQVPATARRAVAVKFGSSKLEAMYVWRTIIFQNAMD